MSMEERRVRRTQPCGIFSNPVCSSLIEKATVLLLLAFTPTLLDYLAEGREGHLRRWGTLLVSWQMILPSPWDCSLTAGSAPMDSWTSMPGAPTSHRDS